ncbi:MAG TPA: c-type cytochrome, partial [Thermoanaerobaculia bacterium]|nr:c-type cytochrome [Thermoanaerobaculia bacterium]
GCGPAEEAEVGDMEVEEEAVGEPEADAGAVEPEAQPAEEALPQPTPLEPEEAAPPVAPEELESEIEEAEPVPPAPVPLPATEAEAAGKQVFLGQRCSTCHSVSTAGIEAKVASGPTAGGDLAGVGERRDRAAIEAILRQEETVGDGKKHPKRFAGSQAELDALIDWLSPQR